MISVVFVCLQLSVRFSATVDRYRHVSSVVAFVLVTEEQSAVLLFILALRSFAGTTVERGVTFGLVSAALSLE